jgi:hypothetical protein
MAGLALPPGFGTNSWNEEKWSRAQGIIGPRFLTAGPTTWRVTVSSTTDRTVNIAPGRGYCCGVYDETTANETLQFDPNTTSASRYDLLVARFNWATNARTFAIIKGGANPPPVNQTGAVDASSINRIPGLQYDAVLAVLQIRSNVGTFAAATDLYESRPWGGTGGGPLVINNDHILALNALDVPENCHAYSVTSGFEWRWDGTYWVYCGTSANPSTAWTEPKHTPVATWVTNQQSYGQGSNNLLSWQQGRVDANVGTYQGDGTFTINSRGLYVIHVQVDSDLNGVGRSKVELQLPEGGQSSYLGKLSDDRNRDTGFAGAGLLAQSLTSPPFYANPGSRFAVNVTQFNPAGAFVDYYGYLTVTRLPG